jgi:DNA-binding CsgD family transcriptional regulator
MASQQLLAAADTGLLDQRGQARHERMRTQTQFGLQLAFLLNRGHDAPLLLLEAAQRLQPLDAGLALESLLEALVAGMYAGRLVAGGGLAEVARGAISVPLGPEPPHPLLLLHGLAVRVLDGYDAAAPLLKEALRQYRAQPVQLDALCHPYSLVAAELCDDDAWFELANREVRLARSSGTLSYLPFALAWLAVFHVRAGEFTEAEALIAEYENIDPGIADRILKHAAVLLAAWRGDSDRAADLMEEMSTAGSRRGEGSALTYVDYAKAVLYNGLADYERASDSAYRAASRDEILVSTWPLPDLVEAAVRAGQTARAAAACDRLSAIAAASGTHSARAAAALGRALVAEGGAAEDLYLEAIGLLVGTRSVATVARAQLCYGEWLRRMNRGADAGTQLRGAFDAFTAMGAKGFAERARRELEAAGEKVRTRPEEPAVELTPQEHQIAQLARTRRTNPEIGAELFLSARTVEWHLHNIFTKFSIGSRHELDAALGRRSNALRSTR